MSKCVCADGKVKLARFTRGNAQDVLDVGSPVRKVCTSDGGTILTVSHDRKVRVWKDRRAP